MAAFQRAVDLGYRYLETDARVTADGVALAFHDATLDRITDRRGRIDRMTWAEVRRARIGGSEPIALLADVLSAWPDVRVNIDVKSARCVPATIETIRRTGAIERVCVGAFSDARVAAVRRALGERLCISLGPRAAVALALAARTGRSGRVPQVCCAQVPVRLGRLRFVDRRYVDLAHRLGLQVHVWTVNDPADMRRLLDLGVDGVMTDRADVLRAILEQRRQWVS